MGPYLKSVYTQNLSMLEISPYLKSIHTWNWSILEIGPYFEIGPCFEINLLIEWQNYLLYYKIEGSIFIHNKDIISFGFCYQVNTK